MIEAALALVPQYGVWLLALTTFLSCLALPVPSSIFMLTAGGFVAVGDLVAWQVMAGAFGGAVVGDQAGYALARAGRRGLPTRIAANPTMARASDYLARRGFIAVFLSRWLFSPLGPYMNFAAGLTAQNWRAFLIAGAAGEVVWVVLYVGLGMRFADDLVALADILGNASGLLAALAVLVAMAVYLKSALARRGRKNA
jgi:membrane-associated protein